MKSMKSSTQQPTGQSNLPLIRLTLVVPFLLEIDKREIDVEKVLSDLKLSRESIFSPEIFVPALVMYELLEALAKAANDPYLALNVGETLDLHAWPLFTEASTRASTVGDFFLRFTMNVRSHATTVHMGLNTNGVFATFTVYRIFEPKMIPSQADAFYVGLFTNIIRHAVGIQWDPSEVVIRVGDLSAVPKHYKNILITQGDRRGTSILFSIQWLILPFDPVQIVNSTKQDTAVPLTFITEPVDYY